MPKFRKKPVVIEAYQTTEARDIPTLEGVLRASPGDWIIRGVQNEEYACKPDIFLETYEPADAEAEAALANALPGTRPTDAP